MVDFNIHLNRADGHYAQLITFKSNELGSTNMLNFLSSFEISSFDSFREAHKNLFIEKMLEIFAVWIIY